METMEQPGHAPSLDALTIMQAPGTIYPSGAEAALEPMVECPFQLVMGQLAQAAVTQQVLHITGELLPRADLVDKLDGWRDLYRLIRLRICPATRVAPLTPAELDALVDAALRPMGQAEPLNTSAQQTLARLRAQLSSCAACETTQQCPWV
jgi:hypothetical protein